MRKKQSTNQPLNQPISLVADFPATTHLVHQRPPIDPRSPPSPPRGRAPQGCPEARASVGLCGPGRLLWQRQRLPLLSRPLPSKQVLPFGHAGLALRRSAHSRRRYCCCCLVSTSRGSSAVQNTGLERGFRRIVKKMTAILRGASERAPGRGGGRFWRSLRVPKVWRESPMTNRATRSISGFGVESRQRVPIVFGSRKDVSH